MNIHRSFENLSARVTADPLADDEGQVVLRSQLTGEAKLAWRFLRQRSHNVRGPLRVTPAEVGSDQGRSEAAGRRSLAALARANLLCRLDQLRDGTWVLQLNEPSDRKNSRLVTVCPQREIDFAPSEAPALPTAQPSLGEGGDFLDAKQQEQNIPPPPHGDFSADGCAGASVSDWLVAERRMQEAGAIDPATRRNWCQAARSRGMKPTDVLTVVDFYHRHRAAWGSPGVLAVALGNWPPIGPGDLWSLFPAARRGYSADPTDQQMRIEERESTNLENDRQTLIAECKAAGLTKLQINEVLRRKGHDEMWICKKED